MYRFLIALSMVLTPFFISAEQSKNYMERDVIEKNIANCRELLQVLSSNNEDVLKMFDETVALWTKYYKEKKGQLDLYRLLTAVTFAAIKHDGQCRKDGAETPYIIHPIGVSRLLWEIGGVRSVNVLAAALLHDTLEDTDTTYDELKSQFGERIAHTVLEVSNDPALSSQENKQRQVDHAPHMTLNGQLVKLADRLYNLHDLRNPPPKWSKDEVLRYVEWGGKLLAALKGTNEPLETALEEEIKFLSSRK